MNRRKDQVGSRRRRRRAGDWKDTALNSRRLMRFAPHSDKLPVGMRPIDHFDSQRLQEP